MPMSDVRNILPVMQAVMSCRTGKTVPMKILDVGAGTGRYGLLFREHLDIYYERYERETWESLIDAVEIWPRWITPVHRHVYNNIFAEDFSRTARDHIGYDVVFFGDVIEHMEKDVARRVIDESLSWNQNVVLCIPDSGLPEVAGSRTMGGSAKYLDNPYEVHKARWYKEDFPDGEFFETPSLCFVVRLSKFLVKVQAR